ncbi:MAG TPA: hypothetical protein VEY67_08180, partial [Candidatus Dormibacteraeota bacterium]|nr:hypothetical protein [Candidatus Dormibacteraeota bacterium]
MTAHRSPAARPTTTPSRPFRAPGPGRRPVRALVGLLAIVALVAGTTVRTAPVVAAGPPVSIMVTGSPNPVASGQA